MKLFFPHAVCASMVLLFGNTASAVKQFDHRGSKVVPDIVGSDQGHRQVQALGSVTTFRVINAKTDKPIAGLDSIRPGSTVTIDLAATGGDLNIEAVTSGTVNSMEWRRGANRRVENSALWAYCGNSGSDFSSCGDLVEGFDATITATPRDKSGNLGTPAPVSIKLIRSRPLPPPLNLTLVNTDTDVAVGPLINGTTIVLTQTPRINVRADAPTGVRSVRFWYDNVEFRTDNIAPYSFNGNAGSDFFPFEPTVGCHTIRAEAFSEADARGNRRAALTADFCVVATPPTKAPTKAPSKTPTKSPTKAPVKAPTKLPTPTCPSVESYINSVTLSGKTLSLSGSSPEDKALQWLVVNDPLQLKPCDETSKARLRQRFAVLSLGFQKIGEQDMAVGKNWFNSTDECQWTGIRCAAGNGALVTEVRMRGFQVIGTIPADAGLLSSMSFFDASFNNFNGTLPSTIGAWADLTRFDVSFNAIAGSLPAPIGAWTDLQFFSAYKNAFTGSVPTTIAQWTNTSYFDVWGNKLTGKLFDAIGMWTKVAHFDIDKNQFVGTVPSSIANWPIRFISADVNNITGTFPAFLNGFCPRTSGRGVFEADCINPVEVVCPCCIVCYDANGESTFA